MPQSRRAHRILVVDNYDSFVHNVFDQLAQLGADVDVRRADAVSVDEVAAGGYAGVVLSPGPGRPHQAGVSVPLVKALGATLPCLGICLGHQAIAVAYGGRIVRARRPLHGRATWIRSERRGLLRTLPARFEAARYHSLVVDPARLGRGLRATAFSAEGEVMALVHDRHPVAGIQIHPESYLTPLGPRIFAAFLRRTGLHVARDARVVR